MPEKLDTAIRDRLARQRTELANERTLLSYIRTTLGFFIVGIPAVWGIQWGCCLTLHLAVWWSPKPNFKSSVLGRERRSMRRFHLAVGVSDEGASPPSVM